MILTLPWPPTVNTYWRSVVIRGSVRVLISKQGQSYRKTIGLMVPATKPLLGSLSIHVEAYPPDRRARDLDNILKSLLDSLDHAGVYKDDSQIDDLHVTRRHVVKGGKVVVTIKSTEDQMTLDMTAGPQEQARTPARPSGKGAA